MPPPPRKAILLAGGVGSRLYPATRAVNKHLLPLDDRPVVYFPLATLIAAGYDDVLVISSPRDLPAFEALLGDGADWGVRFSYLPQAAPRGIAEALRIGADFVGQHPVCLALGDNVYLGAGVPALVADAATRDGATLLACRVHRPEAYGVAELGPDGQVLDLHEKPERTTSPWAVTGLYFYGPDVVERAATLAPSARGELEITDLNLSYLREDRLRLVLLGPDVAWRDVGTPEALHEATGLVRRHPSGREAGCPEAAALRAGFRDADQVRALAAAMPSCAYAWHLARLADADVREPTP